MSAKRFRIAFSFAGEKRDFVANVAAILAKQFGEGKILYDKFHEAEFAHANLAFSLPDLYRKETDLIVAVFCKDYDRKEWCGLEWRAIFAFVKEDNEKPVLLTRFDRADGKGLHGLAGFIDLDKKTPEQAAALILERLAINEGKPKDHYTKSGPALRHSSSGIRHSNTPHNLPHLPFFYGRTEELRKIADALSPKTRTWGALIDGPGGIGKTSLAIRAALEAPEGLFRQILFVSSKSRKLTADGEVKVSDFVVPGYIEMLNEIARLLKQPDLAKSPETDRARLVIGALEPAQALLILDNLESLPKNDQNRLFEFLSQLPPGCKAIVTSRRRTDQDARIIRLAKLEQDAALALLAELEEGRPLLKKAGREDRIHLYEETGGNPLLIRWVAGQLGRGRCRTIATALAFLRSAPKGNDPLEFIFGDLLDTFTEAETKVLAALTYFTQPVETKLIAELAGISETAAGTALGDLASRALVIPDEEDQQFVLVPMAAVYLRNERPEAVEETGDRLEKRAYALIMENFGFTAESFKALDLVWPTIAPALPRFIAGADLQFKVICAALLPFLGARGRWDERLALYHETRARAVTEGDDETAGWWALGIAQELYSRRQADEVLAYVDLAEAHYHCAQVSARKQASVIQWRGHAHRLRKDYPAAISAYRKVIELDRSVAAESVEVAVGLIDLAAAEKDSGDFDAAEGHCREALRIARAVGDDEKVAAFTGNLADLALLREDWPSAETLAREALRLAEAIRCDRMIAEGTRLPKHFFSPEVLRLAEAVRREELFAGANHLLAHALVRQAKAAEALPHARRAVEIFTRLGTLDPSVVEATLDECEQALAGK